MKRDREEEIINGMKTMLKKTERSEVKLMEYKEVTGNENDDGRPREVSTRELETRNSQVHASKNFLRVLLESHKIERQHLLQLPGIFPK